MAIIFDQTEPLILSDGTEISGTLKLFLYALCCLDYENLPISLSRIEEIANALIANETLNIKPQSKSEQFFLSILSGDISNLPEPQTKSEILLNELVKNEFSLSDVEPIQSRYELLIAYLIKKGGFGNFEYILYEFMNESSLLNNTIEAPFKSAILKGNTLVNLAKYKKQVTVIGGSNAWIHVADLSYNLIPNKKYLIKLDVIENSLDTGSNGVNILLREVATGGSTLYSPPLSTLKNGCMVVTIEENYTSIDSIFIYANESTKSGTFTINNFISTSSYFTSQ